MQKLFSHPEMRCKIFNFDMLILPRPKYRRKSVSWQTKLSVWFLDLCFGRRYLWATVSYISDALEHSKYHQWGLTSNMWRACFSAFAFHLYCIWKSPRFAKSIKFQCFNLILMSNIEWKFAFIQSFHKCLWRWNPVLRVRVQHSAAPSLHSFQRLSAAEFFLSAAAKTEFEIV